MVVTATCRLEKSRMGLVPPEGPDTLSNIMPGSTTGTILNRDPDSLIAYFH